MKRLTLSIALFVSLMIPNSSFAEWRLVGESSDGAKFYVDYESIRKHGGLVYWWEIASYLKPTDLGDFSLMTYREGDCKKYRFRILSSQFFKEPIGQGEGRIHNPGVQEWQKYPWVYIIPTALTHRILRLACFKTDGKLTLQSKAISHIN